MEGAGGKAVDTVGTDHCPFDTEQKLMGKDAFTNIPNGIPGIEDRVNLLYTYGVKQGQGRFAAVCGSGECAGGKIVWIVSPEGDD